MSRRTAIEEAHAASPLNPDYSASDTIMGLDERRGKAIIAPAMQKYVAEALRDKAAVMKEKRKAQ